MPSTFYTSLLPDKEVNEKQDKCDPNLQAPPRRHKESLTPSSPFPVEVPKDNVFNEILLRHRQLFEALLTVEGVEDDTLSVSNGEVSQSSIQAPNAYSLLKEEAFLCRTADDWMDTHGDAVSIESENVKDEEISEEKDTVKQRLLAAMARNYAELMDALSETNEDRAKVDLPKRPLSANELRHNIKRCIVQSKPYLDTFAGLYDLFIWQNPLSTLIMFWVYTFCVYKGYVISVILGLILLQLLVNYLTYCRHISLGLNFLPKKDTVFFHLDFNGAQLILEVSRKVQILLEFVADFLEKIKNLFVWKLPTTTWRFVFLVIYWFILSMVLSVSWFLKIVGLGIGVKLFITTYLFHRFPRLRHMFDVFVWFLDRLPSDQDLRELNDNSHVDKSSNKSSPAHVGYKNGSDKVFLNSTGRTQSQSVIVRKCVLVDGEKTFPMNVGSGTLRVTNNHLTFKYHRFNAGSREIIRAEFNEIISVNKTKTIKLTNFGGGTSIEVFVAARTKVQNVSSVIVFLQAAYLYVVFSLISLLDYFVATSVSNCYALLERRTALLGRNKRNTPDDIFEYVKYYIKRLI